MLAPLAGVIAPSSKLTISSATRAGVRPGFNCGFARRSISVSTAPGLIQIAVMPSTRPSTAIASVNPTTPYFETLGGQPREFFRRVDARKGCQIYDPATAGAAHRPEGGAATEEGAGEIDPKRFFPGLRGGRVDGRLVKNGRGTDQRRRRAHAGGDGEEPVDLAAVADVRGRDRCRAAVLADRLADSIQL